MQSQQALRREITRGRAQKAQRLLYSLLDSRSLDPADFDGWGSYAGQIDNLFIRRRQITRSHRFWVDLLRRIRRAERDLQTHIHKGLILFKIAARRWVMGYSWTNVQRYLRAAYIDDRLLYPARNQDAERQSAFRLLTILRLLDAFQKKIRSHAISTTIAQARTLGSKRIAVDFLRAYDSTVINPEPLRRIGSATFRRLLGSGQYTVSVAENYAGASYLIGQRDDLERTNLERYGAAKGVIVLCGSTIEGVLASRRHLTRGLKQEERNLRFVSVSDLPNFTNSPGVKMGQ